MKIIAINSGSSSLKFQLFDMKEEKVIVSGIFERIGVEDSSYTFKYNGDKITEEIELPSHKDAVDVLLKKLTSLEIITSLEEIDGVGHRVLHGKDFYDKSVIVDDEVLNNLNKIIDLGPLHMHANISGIEARMNEKNRDDEAFDKWLFAFDFTQINYLNYGEDKNNFINPFVFVESMTCFLSSVTDNQEALLKEINVYYDKAFGYNEGNIFFESVDEAIDDMHYISIQ